MNSPSPDEGIDDDIEGLLEIVASLDDVTAMAVDEEAEVGGKGFAVKEDVGAFLEVAEPEVVGVVAGPAYAHLLQ